MDCLLAANVRGMHDREGLMHTECMTVAAAEGRAAHASTAADGRNAVLALCREALRGGAGRALPELTVNVSRSRFSVCVL